jgi:hypothetical protein
MPLRRVNAVHETSPRERLRLYRGHHKPSTSGTQHF